MLAAYQAAELAVLKGLSYRIGDLQLTRVDLDQIVKWKTIWERRVAIELAQAAQPLGRGNTLGAVANFSDCNGYYYREGRW